MKYIRFIERIDSLKMLPMRRRVQAEVLKNTRQKLKMLEARISALVPVIEAGGSPSKDETGAGA